MADDTTNTKAPRAPQGLGKAGRQLWRRFFAEVAEGSDPDDLAVLTEACAQRDVVDRIERALADSELIVAGSQGQDVANPLLSELRHHRALLLTLLRRLDLDDEDAPSTSRSAAGRALVRHRWG